ncbi:MAG: hypothetical protein RL071_1399 [Pseudomonadota bacterium]|jgi:rhodanese-related sulfurtransferase
MTTPPLEPVQVRLARLDFQGAVHRDAAYNPVVSAEFAAEQGPRVLIIDVREADELAGPLGAIPTAVHVPLKQISALAALEGQGRLILVSKDGRRAATAARLLEQAGHKSVAAMDGGLLAWRAAGMPTTRSSSTLATALPTDPDAPLRQPDRHPGPLSLAELRAHVEDAPRIRWVKLAAFLLNGRTACVDGRDAQGVVGTPGGDTGEIALALAAAEACGAELSPACIDAVLRGWIEAFGRVYLHSDLHALNQMILALRADPEVPEALLPSREAPPSVWRAFTAKPPAAIQARLLHHLAQPAHVGCGHLRLSMSRAEAYGVRPEVVSGVLQAFFRARWEGLPELDFVVLGGGHQEGAVLLVQLDEQIFPYSHIPLVPPAIGGAQMFVHHPQVTAYQRTEVAHWLATRPSLPALRGRADAVKAALDRLGAQQLQATLGALASGLPIYEATFAEDRSVRVREVGRVGG